MVTVSYDGPYSTELAEMLVFTRPSKREAIFIGLGLSRMEAFHNALVDFGEAYPELRGEACNKASEPNYNWETVEGDEHCKVYCTIKVTP